MEKRAKRGMSTRVWMFSFSLFMALFQGRGYSFGYDEPDNFAGLKFGENLTQQMDECPHSISPLGNKFNDYPKINKLGKRCYSEPVPKSYVLYNMGEIKKYLIEIRAQQLDGKLAKVDLMMTTANAPILLSMLNERYGKPTEQSQQPWTSKTGVKTTSLLAIWRGANVSIVFNERWGQIDWGLITYESSAWATEKRRLEVETIKKGAGGL